jgi:hypothetical protein
VLQLYILLTASPTQVVNSMCHEEMHHQMQICRRLCFYRACLAPTLLFVIGISAPLRGVNNVIGLHESCLGQLPWDRFTGRVPFTEGFFSSGYQLGFSALLISLEFFPHTCNNSSKVVNDVLVGLSFGNYSVESKSVFFFT